MTETDIANLTAEKAAIEARIAEASPADAEVLKRQFSERLEHITQRLAPAPARPAPLVPAVAPDSKK